MYTGTDDDTLKVVSSSQTAGDDSGSNTLYAWISCNRYCLAIQLAVNRVVNTLIIQLKNYEIIPSNVVSESFYVIEILQRLVQTSLQKDIRQLSLGLVE